MTGLCLLLQFCCFVFVSRTSGRSSWKLQIQLSWVSCVGGGTVTAGCEWSGSCHGNEPSSLWSSALRCCACPQLIHWRASQHTHTRTHTRRACLIYLIIHNKEENSKGSTQKQKRNDLVYGVRSREPASFRTKNKANATCVSDPNTATSSFVRVILLV